MFSDFKVSFQMYPRYMGVIRLVFMFNFNQLDIHKKLVLSQQIYNEAQKNSDWKSGTPLI